MKTIKERTEDNLKLLRNSKPEFNYGFELGLMKGEELIKKILKESEGKIVAFTKDKSILDSGMTARQYILKEIKKGFLKSRIKG